MASLENSLYGMEETPDEVYRALLRLEGRDRNVKLVPLEGDHELVQEHIRKKCLEIREYHKERLRKSGLGDPDRIAEAGVRRGLEFEEIVRHELRHGRIEL
jgi:hypothetical protein